MRRVMHRIAQNKGFTLLEFSVVILVIVIISFKAFSYVEHALEDIRIADAISLMGTEVAAQDRYRVLKGTYTRRWDLLDNAPLQMRTPSENNRFANGASNTIFYTRGKHEDGTFGQGFQIYFEDRGLRWFMTADRVGSKKYNYTLVRAFDNPQIICVPNDDTKKSLDVCLDFMNVKTAEELPGDPRLW